MNIIDRAYNLQMSGLRASVAHELVTLEHEIIEARKGMRESWNELCEAEGLSPKDIKRMEVLEVSEGNEKLGENCWIFSRLYSAKISKYLRLCRQHQMKPDPRIIKIKEVHTNNESSSSNNRNSKVAPSNSGRRQHRGRGNSKLSGRGPKRKRR